MKDLRGSYLYYLAIFFAKTTKYTRHLGQVADERRWNTNLEGYHDASLLSTADTLCHLSKPRFKNVYFVTEFLVRECCGRIAFVKFVAYINILHDRGCPIS
jgi:hypothetical protein